MSTNETPNLATALRQSLDEACHSSDHRELAKAQSACQTLGNVVVSQARSLYAAWIEVRRGDLHAASQWVLNSVPDVWDGSPEEEWNGTETAGEWFDRTTEPAGGATS